MPTDDFDARSGDELTLRRSERVELIELDDDFGDGWYLGRHLTRGGTGLFPGGNLPQRTTSNQDDLPLTQSSLHHQSSSCDPKPIPLPLEFRLRRCHHSPRSH